MRRIVRLDGLKVIQEDPTGKGEGRAGLTIERTACFKCHQPIGLDTPYWEVNGQLVHDRCRREL